jgi:hydrogenase assembly chaperone HypC/HupF
MMNKTFFVHPQRPLCQIDTDHHCLTCSDEAIPVRVVSVEPASGTALVEVSGQIEEIDVMLVEDVAPGDLLLAHGGVAIARLEDEDANPSRMNEEETL